MSRLCQGALAGLALVLFGCAPVSYSPHSTQLDAARERTRQAPPDVQLFFRGDRPYARRAGEVWALGGDVTKQEMVFSPDGKRFAYVRNKAEASLGRATSPPHVLVRNLAGDPVNDFPVYRPGPLTQLSWVDNRRLAYLEPASGKRHDLYVVHDADTGEILAARPGRDFVWAPRHRHVAFIAGKGGREALVVDGRNVWPRAGGTRLHGDPSWSPDGRGIALVEEGVRGPRLVVMVEFTDPQGDLTWPIPREAVAPGMKVFWASPDKVVIGETALEPKFAAGWQRMD